MMSTILKRQPDTVLYVEDEETDVLLMREAFQRTASELRLRTVGDGQQALDYLAGRNGFGQRWEYPLPALVLLDLKLPLVHGFEVLKWLRGQEQFKGLPVVVFSSSAELSDKQEADRLGADWYLEKPISPKQWRELVREVQQRWLQPDPGAGRSGGGQENIRMRKLVQQKATKAFLTESGAWTMDCGRAQVFATRETAKAAAIAHQASGVELYYLFGEEVSQYDFTISLLP